MKLFATISTPEDIIALQSDLTRLEKYCLTNKLDLNPGKCSVVTFTRKRDNLTANYTFGGLTIARTERIRDLGIHHDSKLLFDAHVDAIVKKASKSLGFIMRLSKCFTEAKTLKILYCTFVRNNLEYASQIWNPRYFKYVDRIENIQKRFIKYLCFHQKIPYQSSQYLQLCKKFHLLPLVKRRDIADYIFILKIIQNLIDSPELLYKINFNVPFKSSRFHPPLQIPLAATNYRQNSLMIRASRSFNNLSKQHDFDPFMTNINVARRLLSLDFFK